jgi:tetratricopeptide (TPR) repeat protein
MLLMIAFAYLPAANVAFAQSSDWEEYNNSGMAALKQGRYADAEEAFLSALKEAEKFGPQDTRLVTSLNNLAVLYANQGKYAQAEPLHKRALAINEKTLGPEHPDVAQSLENYATLLRITKRVAEAEKLEARAREIRAKQQ